MGSREKILEKILQAGGKTTPLPEIKGSLDISRDTIHGFISVLEKIGGKVVEVKDWLSLREYVLLHYSGMKRIISTQAELPWYIPQLSNDPHSFEDVDLAILRGHFGVAENGAVWITDELMGDRSIPFITQHLALVINKSDIVPTLHEAYEKIAASKYEYGTFIAGPSKTADIEQSLVLGAHGPKSMVVFLMANE